MKRKLFAILLTLCLLPTLALSAYAFDNDTLQFITDEAELLTDQQRSALESLSESVSREYNCGLYVVILQDYLDYGATMASVSDRIYEDNSLGWGSEADGLVLLLSMEDRDYLLSSYGSRGQEIFNTAARKELTYAFISDFEYNNWYNGLMNYLNECRLCQQTVAVGKTYGGMSLLMKLILILLLPMLVALIVCLILKAQMRSVRKQSFARVYMTVDPEGLRVCEDIYTHTTETRRKVQNSSSSSNNRTGGKF